MNIRQSSKSKVSTSSDKSSLWWLYGLITLGYALSFSIGATRIGRIYDWNTLFIVGMALFVIGFIIRIHSLLTLKQYFTCSGPLKLDSFLVILRGWSGPDDRVARRSRTQRVSDTPAMNGSVSSCIRLQGNVQSGNGHRQNYYTRIGLPPLL